MAIDKNVNNRNSVRKSQARKSTPNTHNKNNTGRKRNTSKKKKKKLGFFTILKRLFLTLFFIGLTLGVVGCGYVFAVIKSAPPLDLQAVLNLSQPTSMYDKDGVFMDTLHSEIDRTVVSYDTIPQYLKDGFVSIEDQRFEKHKGVDPIRIGGSLVTDVKKIFRGQTGFHGGSTITQQLLKNTVLSDETSAVQRKIKEIWYALRLEKQLSKDEILNQYLNTIPLGGTAYGVEAASNLYFGKSVSELNLIQCAYISGIAQAPTYYSAYNQNNQKDPTPYIVRTKSVLKKMLELNKITEAQYNEAISDIDSGKLQFTSTKKSYTLEYEWYINPTVTQVKEDLKKKYKYTDEEVSKLLANGGLKITTNMNRALQDYTQNLLDNYSASNVGKQETYYANTKTPEFQASATIVDYKTGKVLAMVGGRGQHGANSMNRAYSTLKPIGSTTKPLTVYGPAINEHVLTAASTIDDSPIDLNTEKSMNGGRAWNLQNDDHTFAGNVTLRYGLRDSKNVVAVKALHTLGVKTALSYGEKFGLKYNDSTKSSYATLGLGQFSGDGDGGNTFITSSAFGVFGNGGTYTTPKLYSKVTDASGNLLLNSEDNPETKQIFSSQTAWIMYDLLKGSRSKTGPSAQWGSMPTAGKTGTTSNNTDFWFTGLTPYLSGSVWLGYDTPTPMPYGSSNQAAALWGKIMAKAHEGMENTEIEMPSGISTATICMDSGKLASDLCYSDSRDRVYDEYFIDGTEPTSYCDAHVLLKVNSANNKIAGAYTPGFLIRHEVYVKKSNPNPVTQDYPYLVPNLQEDDYSENAANNDIEDAEKEAEENLNNNDDDNINNIDNLENNENNNQGNSSTNQNTNTNNNNNTNTNQNNNNNSRNVVDTNNLPANSTDTKKIKR
ncbi:penicillin-binding protein 1A [Clostridium sp. DSM 8431]|uniref:transglycosylase domain-containing protein n=1 Tax=Clostridium sp. DSM 8431 TaxID=1761781 RepID=UPI0008E67701|nr:transglycosylase domain-containing protein [Clostridium sp. DSM 8431]SFU33827.1 penicillin-binding protein 1A [Clostridium sp. DSM 8431]